eukprot:TRINITY_DN20484_c0_g1_i1.p1 TRINITY_DN20484_c0_g1~~TRINITY_DN20484_c0_g1_i1.p1  ORF type:complete len:350 (+),score=77.14 TRINITY_DN20484_c0_g1_i1:22-1071(+)
MMATKQTIFLVLLCGLSCIISGGNAQVTPLSRAYAGVFQLMEWYDPMQGQWNEVGWWHSGNCLTVVIDYCLASGDQSYQEFVQEIFALNQVFNFEGYDDEGWWALAWLQAYEYTHDRRFLEMTANIFEDMAKAWSNECGGGIWWDRAFTYKNAITNELFLATTAKLYLHTKNQTYLEWAEKEWTWFNQSGLINGQHLINDGLLSTCGNNNAQTWTYNQGVILGGLVALAQATGNTAYLEPACQIANATMSILVTDNILQEVCEPSKNCNSDQIQFKGIFMRNLAELYKATRISAYADFINNNADSIWNNDRNGNALGVYWNGPYDNNMEPARHSSAVDALVASLSVSSF